MRPELLVVFYCIAVGATAAGFINSAVELVAGHKIKNPPILSPRYTILHMLLNMMIGSLGFYQRARVHGKIAMEKAPNEWAFAALSACIGLAWSFLMGLAVLNLVHLIG